MADWQSAAQALLRRPISEHAIKRTPVALAILFTFATAGIYVPCWFLTRRAAINSLDPRERLGQGVFIFAIVLLAISLLLSFAIGGFEGTGEESGDQNLLHQARMLDLVDRMISLVVGITLLVQCFKVRRMMQRYSDNCLGGRMPFSGVFTFLFGVFYLQYKINRL